MKRLQIICKPQGGLRLLHRESRDLPDLGSSRSPQALQSFVSQNCQRSSYTRILTGQDFNYDTKPTLSFLNPGQLRLYTCECGSNTGHKSTLGFFGTRISGAFQYEGRPHYPLGHGSQRRKSCLCLNASRRDHIIGQIGNASVVEEQRLKTLKRKDLAPWPRLSRPTTFI